MILLIVWIAYGLFLAIPPVWRDTRMGRKYTNNEILQIIGVVFLGPVFVTLLWMMVMTGRYK